MIVEGRAFARHSHKPPAAAVIELDRALEDLSVERIGTGDRLVLLHPDGSARLADPDRLATGDVGHGLPLPLPMRADAIIALPWAGLDTSAVAAWRSADASLHLVLTGATSVTQEYVLTDTVVTAIPARLDADAWIDLVVLTRTGPVLMLSRGGGLEVNSPADNPDSEVGDGICDIQTPPQPPPDNICTLRAALQETIALGGGSITAAIGEPVVIASNLPIVTGGQVSIVGDNALEVRGELFANTAFRANANATLAVTGVRFNSIALAIHLGNGSGQHSIHHNRFGVGPDDRPLSPVGVLADHAHSNSFADNVFNGFLTIQGSGAFNQTIAGNRLGFDADDPESGEFLIGIVNNVSTVNIVDNLVTTIILEDANAADGRVEDVLLDGNHVGVDAEGVLVGRPQARSLGIHVAGAGHARHSIGATIGNRISGQQFHGITANGIDVEVVNTSGRNIHMTATMAAHGILRDARVLPMVTDS